MELTGWLLDVYEDRESGGVKLWLLGEDRKPHPFLYHFPIDFYAVGENHKLRALWKFILQQPEEVKLFRETRKDLHKLQPIDVMRIQVQNPANLFALFKRCESRFPDLVYYDVDIPLLTRFSAKYDVFPLTRCALVADDSAWVQGITTLESRWEIDPQPIPLTIMYIQPNTDPKHKFPSYVTVQISNRTSKVPVQPGRELLLLLRGLLRIKNPDLIYTKWGDTWLFPYLLELSEKLDIPINLSRDKNRGIEIKKELTYHTYGQVMYRGQQALLYGRWHIDGLNAMMFGDYGLDGVFELARVSGLPVQEVARKSPGAGISAMQIITALRDGILVPYHKQQVEHYKTALNLIHVDQGGLVYQPTIGLHEHVAEIDFVSMYPSIMRRFNISPETIEQHHLEDDSAQELQVIGEGTEPGILPQTLAPLLDKRIALKEYLLTLEKSEARYQSYKARANALKWLLVVCFGYTGYKHAKFGKIEAHIAITAYSREILLRSKEIAEAEGFTVLHMYVDGLWIKKPGASKPEDFQIVLDRIAENTGLSISLEGVFRWVAFLSSKLDTRVPVPNRYFGVYQNGEIKMRGIEARRGDTPQFIKDLQAEMLLTLALASSVNDIYTQLPRVINTISRYYQNLRRGKVKLTDLVVRLKLGKDISAYKVRSPAAIAASQLEEEGKPVRVGQRIPLLYASGRDKVIAWDLSVPPTFKQIDVTRYENLLFRATETILLPFGVDEKILRAWVISQASYLAPPGILVNGDYTQPLFSWFG